MRVMGSLRGGSDYPWSPVGDVSKPSVVVGLLWVAVQVASGSGGCACPGVGACGAFHSDGRSEFGAKCLLLPLGESVDEVYHFALKGAPGDVEAFYLVQCLFHGVGRSGWRGGGVVP